MAMTKPMITRRGRLYIFRFYRVLKDQAENAVKSYHEKGYCAFKIKADGGNGWAIYEGGKKKRVIITEKYLQERNMKLMIHHLTKAKEAFQRYKKNGGKRDFHFTTEEWGSYSGLVKAYDFSEGIEEAIYVVEVEIGDE